MEAPILAIEVFVSSGVPDSTYVSRDSVGLAEKLEEAKYNNQVTVVSGTTKSGKSVLAEKVFPENEAVWLQGGNEDTGRHFWQRLLEGLGENIHYQRQKTTTEGKTKSAEGGVNLGGLKLGGGGEDSLSHQITEIISAHGDLVGRACKLLLATKTPVVIDDFHLLPEDLRKGISRTAKGLVFKGVPIILLTLPHRREDVIKALPELMGRVKLIRMPPWSEEELIEIADKGFSALNIGIAPDIISAFAKASRASPWLMQKFCLHLCESEGVKQKSSDLRKITYSGGNLDNFFRTFAQEEPESVYVSFVKGPTNKKRKRHKFTSGGEGDIYEVIARALSRLLRENGGSFSYQTLKEELEKVLTDMPPTGEISQALNQMSKIKVSGEDSDTLFTFDKHEEMIYINDPYLAFYLIWGVMPAPGNETE